MDNQGIKASIKILDRLFYIDFQKDNDDLKILKMT